MVGFWVFMALFFLFSEYLKFFMLVRDDTKEAVTSGREVLWDTVCLAEATLWFGRRLCWRGAMKWWVEPTVKGAYLPGCPGAQQADPRQFPRLPVNWSPSRRGRGLPTMMHWTTASPWQSWGSSSHVGQESPGKQGKLDSFTVKTPCWIFALSVLGL